DRRRQRWQGRRAPHVRLGQRRRCQSSECRAAGRSRCRGGMAEQLNLTWLDAQLAGAPDELVARTREFVRREGDAVTPDALARAGRAALATAVAESPDRTAALDLLAADAL